MKKNIKTLFQNSFFTRYILWSLLIFTIYSLFDALYIYFRNGLLFYMDTDSYTRALRITDWLQEFRWPEKIFPYSNAPFGDILHFTRIMDIIWVVLSAPFLAFLPLKEAVFYGGMIIPPFFGFLSIITILWGIRPYLENYKKNWQSFIFAYIFAYIFTLIYMLKLINIFSIQQPDHHALMFWIFCLNISALLRYYRQPRLTLLFYAGLAAGCGIWASSAVEGFLLAGSILILLTGSWLKNHISLLSLKIYSLGLFLATTTGWLLNPPYGGYGIIDNTRLSAIHIIATLFMLCSFYIVGYFKPNTLLRKLCLMLFFAAISLTGVCLLFGIDTVFAPVYTQHVRQHFLPYIGEMQPLPKIFYPSIILGIVEIFALFIFFKIKTRKLAYLSALTFMCLPLGLYIYRLYYYLICPLIYINIIFLFHILSYADQNIKGKFLAFGYICISILYFYAFRSEIPYTISPKISGTIAADTFSGPRLSFEQNVKTVAMPYHSTEKAIKDNYDIFFTTDEKHLKTLLRKHQATYIYLDKSHAAVRSYYVSPTQNTDKLYGKIITGKDLYPWLEDLSHPKKEYYLYKINYEKF